MRVNTDVKTSIHRPILTLNAILSWIFFTSFNEALDASCQLYKRTVSGDLCTCISMCISESLDGGAEVVTQASTSLSPLSSSSVTLCANKSVGIP